MGQTVPLWLERTDAVTTPSLVLLSGAFDAQNVGSVTIGLLVKALGTGASLTLEVQESMDQEDWNLLSTSLTATAAGSQFALAAGGQASGSTQALGPFIRFRATVSGTSGATVTWSAVAIAR